MGKEPIWDLFDRLDALRPHVFRYFPPRSSIRAKFGAAFRHRDNELPRKNAVAEALSEFDQLPEETRRKILNGWKDCGAFPNFASVAELDQNMGLSRILSLNFCANSTSCFKEVVLHNHVEAVNIRIVEGTPKDEAIEALRNALDLLELRWGEFVGMSDEGFDGYLKTEEEKKRPSESPAIPKCESKKDRSEMKPTAA